MIKNTVNLFGLKPEMVLVDNIIRRLFLQAGYVCVITSGLDSHSGRLSFHNLGWALDYRTKNLPDAVLAQLMDDLATSLPQCDFRLEDRGKPNEHLHSEFDPKNDAAFVAAKVVWKATGVWPNA